MDLVCVCVFVLLLLVFVCVCAGGWVHCVSFSPSGNKLAWVAHDASISVVSKADGGDQ